MQALDRSPRSRRPGGAGPHLAGGCRHHRLALAALALVPLACGGRADPAPSCADAWDRHCDHPIDALLIPRLRGLGIEPRDAEPLELCRRLAVDFLGRGPSPDELERCVSLGANERVALFQDTPEYVAVQRRAWSEILGYDAYQTWSRDLADLDARVAALHAGEIDYARFATEVAAHPAFFAMHPYDQWAQALFSVFLGRTARADEIAGLSPLTAPWWDRVVCEGPIWWNAYSEAREEGAGDAEAAALADESCAETGKPEWGLNPCVCQPDDGLVGCFSSVLGVAVVLHPRCAEPDDPYSEANVVRLREDAPGQDDTCPDGSRRRECRDRRLGEDEVTLSQLPKRALVSPATRSDLDMIGAALAARPDFWEAAADREIRRLVGWWQAGFRHPDSDLPEVRALVAELLHEAGSVRDIQRLIATSLLYTAPAAPPPGWSAESEPPPWAMGPTKLLAAEPWLDTALLALGESPGACDVRYVTAYGYDPFLADPRELDTGDSSLDASHQDGYYIDAAVALGGCPGATPRPTQSSVGLAFAQSEHAGVVCAYGGGALPPGWDGADLAAAAEHLVRRLLGRPVAADEADALVAEMEACMAAAADGESACADPEAAVRWLCQRIIDSTEFATY